MKVNINGIDTSYIQEGSGEAVLILPGWSATSPVYNILIKQLAQKYCVTALDLPGFGITPEPDEAWGIDDYADFVTEFIKKMGLDNVTLIGHSFGGRIIINLFNRQRAFTVRKVVLIDSAGIKNPLTDTQKKRQQKFKRLKKLYGGALFKAIFPKAIEKLQNKYGSADYAAASPVMKQTLVKTVSTDYTNTIGNINADTLLIWGENDTATPLSNGQMMNRLIDGSKLEVISGAGHFPFIDKPFEFRKIIKENFGLPD